MCGEVVAAPLSLQDTVYPILRKKSLHFCENSKKFLKLCTAVRKKYKMKRLRRKTCSDGYPFSLAALASSPKGELFEVAIQFLIAFDTLATGLTACALSVCSLRSHPHSPFCRCATSSPGAGEVFPQRERHAFCRELPQYA